MNLGHQRAESAIDELVLLDQCLAHERRGLDLHLEVVTAARRVGDRDPRARQPGLDGLVHVSRLALDRRVSHPRQIVSIGDRVDVTVVEIDPVKRRIGLSMIERVKQAKEAAEADERRDTENVLAQSSEKPSLGTLADLLARSPRPKR